VKDNTITCDGCGADLTTSGNSIDFRLELKTARIPSGGGAVTDMLVEPELTQDYHFCRLSCLDKWRCEPKPHL
jgi:hypothetical protein